MPSIKKQTDDNKHPQMPKNVVMWLSKNTKAQNQTRPISNVDTETFGVNNKPFPRSIGQLIHRIRMRNTPRRNIMIVSLLIVIVLMVILPMLFWSMSFGPGGELHLDIGSLLKEAWYLLPFGIAGALSWSMWAIRWITARQYKPIVNDFRTTTSVIVPSYREDPDVTIRCLKTWLQDDPTEIIMVVDIDDTDVLEALEQYEDERLRVIPFKHRGKRSALGVGIRAAKYEILVLTDSDTSWEPGLLDAIQMPFVDPEVGGVSTRQNAYLRDTSIWRIVADWLVNTRYLDYVPLEGMVGGVTCLSGRTAAYRRSAVVPVHDRLEYEYFMGRLCVAGDDGRLTWLVLAQGYKTVYQSSARAWSMFPNQLNAFIKQRIRWSRNSFRCYLTSIATGWLWEQPLLTQIRVLQILAVPLTSFFMVCYIVLLAIDQSWWLFAVGLIWIFVGRGIRSISHLREYPKDIFALPLVTVMILLIALPIKIWAFITMNKHGWLTRSTDSVGGQGQSEASLRVYPELFNELQDQATSQAS